MDEQGLRGVIADHFGVPQEMVVPEADFRRDLGADSLDLISLTMAIEEAYDVQIGDEESLHCLNVATAARLLSAKLAGKSDAHA